MQIFLVRHPKPRNIDGLCYGRLDVTVDPQQLIEAADSVLAHIPKPLLVGAHVYSSPSPRCLAFARKLAGLREPTLVEDLEEMSFGHWEGRAWDAIPRDQMDAWAADVWGYQPGGGESAAMVEARWRRWLDRTRRIDADADSVIAVTHAGVIRVALAGVDRHRSSAALQIHVAFGSVHCLNPA
jgi:alpha-ribazole phosphatase